MRLNKKLFFVSFLFFLSLKAQQINIILKNFDTESIKKGDSILSKKSDGTYSFERKICEKKLSLTISNQEILIKNLPQKVRFIIIDYAPSAEQGCYVINQSIGDVVESFNIENIKNCSAVTNIGLYEKNSLPTVKLKIKN